MNLVSQAEYAELGNRIRHPIQSDHLSIGEARRDGPEVNVTSNLLVQTKIPQNSLGNQDRPCAELSGV